MVRRNEETIAYPLDKHTLPPAVSHMQSVGDRSESPKSRFGGKQVRRVSNTGSSGPGQGLGTGVAGGATGGIDEDAVVIMDGNVTTAAGSAGTFSMPGAGGGGVAGGMSHAPVKENGGLSAAQRGGGGGSEGAGRDPTLLSAGAAAAVAGDTPAERRYFLINLRSGVAFRTNF